MEQVRWGIIGVGDVTEVKSGPGFAKAEGSSLQAVMRRTASLAEDYARRHQVPTWYSDAQALIDDPQVDAVYIATPPDSHCALTLACAQAGKPVYVEKPMALNADEGERMVAACKAAGVPLWVAYYRRAMPRFHMVKELIAEQTIGRPRFVQMRQLRPLLSKGADGQWPWRVQPAQSGGGLFVDMGSHTLDLMDWIFGPVEEVAGQAASLAGAYPAEDYVAGSFKFTSGVRGQGLWCYCADREEELNTIVGEKGRISFSTLGTEPIRLETAEGAQAFDVPPPAHVQQPLIQTIVDELTGDGRCESTGETGLRTTRVIDALLSDYQPPREPQSTTNP